MKKKIISLLTLVFITIACNKENIDPGCSCGSGPQLNLSFALIDHNDNDLLNPENEYSYDHSGIKIYTDSKLKNDITSKWSPIESDSILIVKKESENIYFIELIAQNENFEEKKETVYLKISENDIDTITTYFEYTPFARVVKFEYNNEVIFDNNTIQRSINGYEKILKSLAK